MSLVIDCVKPPSVDAMRRAGVTGLCRYLSWSDQRDTLGKVIHQREFDQLRAAGFDIMLNWEYAAQDYLGGAMRGATHAQEAIRQARTLGYPLGCAIVGSADHDVSRSDWLGTGRPYYMAFSSGLRVAGYRAGIYGPWDVLTWARDDNVADVFWQAGMSTAWSAGRNAKAWPGAHLRQRRQTTIGGVDCDLNDVIQPNYGQYGGTSLFTPQQEALIVAGCSTVLRQARGFDTLDDGHERNLFYDMVRTAAGQISAPAAVDIAALVAQLAPAVAALLPHPPTAAEVADELQRRLQG